MVKTNESDKEPSRMDMIFSYLKELNRFIDSKISQIKNIQKQEYDLKLE